MSEKEDGIKKDLEKQQKGIELQSIQKKQNKQNKTLKEEKSLLLQSPKETKAPDTVMSKLVAEDKEKAEQQKQSVMVQSADMKRLLEDYKKFCKKQEPPMEVNEDKLKEDKDGKVSLDFKSPEQMTDFFKQQAADGRRFVMVDAETNKVLAYSNGDGKLYRPGLGKDKQPEEISGKSLLPGKEQMNDLPDHKGFSMPEPEAPKMENK